MSQLIEFSRKRVFHLEDAQQLVPIIVRMTEVANAKVRSLLHSLEALSDREAVRAKDLEAQIDAIVRQWQQKIEKLGAVSKGLWLVDFDNGEGYFCWKFPERKIMFFHGYHDGFSGRKTLHGCEELTNNEH